MKFSQKLLLNNIIILSLFLFITSCNTQSQQEKKQQAFLKVATIGGITNPVLCREDRSESYAVYLPPTYSINKKWPIIYAFDSHSNGLLPVNLFKKAAEKYGYIVVGSNDSKNGLSTQETNAIVSQLFADSREKLSIDTTRIYTAGFSGGARVACSAALKYPFISGIIACSAGCSANEIISRGVSIIGIAGMLDMNYLELRNLMRELDNSNVQHYLLTFNGKHEWPSSDLIEEAVSWLELDAIRNKKAIAGKNTLDGFTHIKNELSQSKSLPDQYLLLNKTIRYYNGVYSLEEFDAKLRSLSSEKEVISWLEQQKRDEIKEQQEQHEIVNHFLSYNEGWWQQRLSNLKKESQNSAIASRLLGYVSLLSYSATNQSLQQRDLASSAIYLKIYGAADPENPDFLYFSACYQSQQGRNIDALNFLKLAIDKGFNDKNKLQQDHLLDPLRSMPEFQTLQSKIQ
jgi:dienelactone hydrolase